MDQKAIVLALVIGTAGSVLGTWVIHLLKPLWVRLETPTPPSMEERVKLAKQLETDRAEMERLRHLSSSTKDLFLYLFRLALSALGFGIGAIVCFTFQPEHPFVAATATEPAGMSVLTLCGFGLVALAAVLILAGVIEAHRLSDKKTKETLDSVQTRIDDGVAKLGPPIVVASAARRE